LYSKYLFSNIHASHTTGYFLKNVSASPVWYYLFSLLPVTYLFIIFLYISIFVDRSFEYGLYLCKSGGGQHLFPEPSVVRFGQYCDITSRGMKRVERERGD
jgi:hypothetical protein